MRKSLLLVTGLALCVGCAENPATYAITVKSENGVARTLLEHAKYSDFAGKKTFVETIDRYRDINNDGTLEPLERVASFQKLKVPGAPTNAIGTIDTLGEGLFDVLVDSTPVDVTDVSSGSNTFSF